MSSCEHSQCEFYIPDDLRDADMDTCSHVASAKKERAYISSRKYAARAAYMLRRADPSTVIEPQQWQQHQKQFLIARAKAVIALHCRKRDYALVNALHDIEHTVLK